MRILINPRFLKKFKHFKSGLKPFMAVEFENQIAQIEKNPLIASRLGDTKFYRKEIKTDYFAFDVAYEYDESNDTLIYWDIDKST